MICNHIMQSCWFTKFSHRCIRKNAYLVLICSFKEVLDTDDVAKEDDDDAVKASAVETPSSRILTTFFMVGLDYYILDSSTV